MSAKDKLVVALDVETVDEAATLISELKDHVGMFKVGSQLFTAAGPSLVEKIVHSGNKVFLDLKFHDIPHQVAGAARSAAKLGVSMFTIHASGGREMMQRAVESVNEVAEQTRNSRARIVAVSVLTSMDANTLSQIGMTDDPIASVNRLVALAQTAGVDGVVSSPQEAATIRSTTGAAFLIVTPGLRPTSTSTEAEDQKRIATPANALKAGADYLVVGRPITGAPSPYAAAQDIIEELEAAQKDTEQAATSNV